MLGMVFCFLWSVFDLGQGLDPSNLLPIFDGDQGYHNYIWSALPYYMTSFGFVAVVPSLYKYYKDDAKAINKSIFWGSLLSLIVFFVFILLAFGNIDRDTFETLNTSESPLTAFLAQLTGGPDGGQSGRMISLFTNLAIVSSFMGTGLGLFDYISDKLQFGDTSMDRLKVALLTFLPPGLASFLFPNGFIAAIGFAGIVYVIGFFILSFFMVKKSRANEKAIRYKVFGGNLILYFFLLLSMLILVTYILTLCDEIIQDDPEGTIMNFLLTCGPDNLWVYSWPGSRPGSTVWNGLHYTTRAYPFTTTRLRDCDYEVDFSSTNEIGDCVSVIATKPLTENEDWIEMQKGELIVFDRGRPNKTPESLFEVELLGHGLNSSVLERHPLEEDMREFDLDPESFLGSFI